MKQLEKSAEKALAGEGGEVGGVDLQLAGQVQVNGGKVWVWGDEHQAEPEGWWHRGSNLPREAEDKEVFQWSQWHIWRHAFELLKIDIMLARGNESQSLTIDKSKLGTLCAESFVKGQRVRWQAKECQDKSSPDQFIKHTNLHRSDTQWVIRAGGLWPFSLTLAICMEFPFLVTFVQQLNLDGLDGQTGSERLVWSDAEGGLWCVADIWEKLDRFVMSNSQFIGKVHAAQIGWMEILVS